MMYHRKFARDPSNKGRKKIVRKEFLTPAAEVVSFLSQDALMSYYDDGDIGGLTPGESGAGGSSGWGDF